ncbi:hypothetical protein RB653_004458 [Dictyostelium firmibasis]|uniref:DUF4282 domain-containing protein n=1 Tax=Dictyostelium firmibasis TaxID=79012 RepID=A0AAN7TZP9_9MYCE
MNGQGKYVGFGNEKSSSDTPFPETRSNWKELLYLRSWQASGFVTVLYYFSFLVGLMYFIQNIVIFTKELGAGGFFLGLLYGTLYFISFILVARIGSEIVLSIFDIRDNVYRISANSGPSIVSSVGPSNSYQGSYQQPTYQPPQPQQPPQQSQPQSYQQSSSTEFPKYQEPYQGNL